MRSSFWRATWAIWRKDVLTWLRQPTNIAATFLPPLLFLLVQALGASAVGRSPVALVVQDTGAHASQVAQAIRAADVFRLREVPMTEAQELLRNLDVVAAINIPAGFTRRVDAGQPAPIEVTVNNLNLDFTNDIRRAVPDAITQYYARQGAGSPVKIAIHEQDLRAQDVELFQYAVLPTIVLLLLISGLMTSGLATAREWEEHTVKELILSPAPGGAIIAGKVLAGFVTTFMLGLLVLGAGVLLGWIHPVGVYWLTTLLIILLVALFAAGLGVAIGVALRRIMPVIAVAINAALYLFFLAGGISVIAFEPDWLQEIAAFVPLTYGNHALQMALFYNSTDALSRDVAVLGGTALLTVVLGSLAVRRRLSG